MRRRGLVGHIPCVGPDGFQLSLVDFVSAGGEEGVKLFATKHHIGHNLPFEIEQIPPELSRALPAGYRLRCRPNPAADGLTVVRYLFTINTTL